ncbi:MAG TPA: radical SAM protein [Oceanithermus profundus]|uniref:Radical SAM protein n=1 Tax=Oceanithermus profundus TaxID=187137 RepID=A0A7C5SSE7_9DEIN|nr:radical SAM protein [Oceanithermus profundus]
MIHPDPRHVLSFDREGRLYTFYDDGVLYKRALDSTLHWRRRAPGGPRERGVLGPEEARTVFARVYEHALRAAELLDPACAERIRSEVLPWTPERLAGERERFSAIYRPIAILPPDQYFAIVVQATEGCTWNKCTFCSFYQGRPFHAKTPEQLREHAEAVRDFLGRQLLLRRGVFLADGNALALSRSRLLPIFEAVREVFPGRPVFSFVDLYSGERHDPADWGELARLGLERVYVGMETGHDELLAFLNKPGSARELEAFVRELKGAGVGVGLIVMVGVGGRGYREAHARATLAALARMPLDRRDLVYLSPFVEHPDSVYARERAAAGLEPMSWDEIEAETARLAAEVRRLGVRAARYDIREFIY